MKQAITDNSHAKISVRVLDETLSKIPMRNVKLLDTYEKNAFSLEVRYLKALDSDRLLRGFCDIAGVESSSELYGGWENSAIRGHTMGHYLTALSQGYAASGDKELKRIADRIISVLSQCQNAETGYLAAIPESHYEQLETGNTAGTWVPWYTMHKILSGLISTYELTGNKEALCIASGLGDWVYSRTSKWSKEIQLNVLNVEYGGMNDCLYQLYSHTKSEKHLLSAHSFDEMELFESLYNGHDILNGKHANTTIPKIIGALNRYAVLGAGEEYYLQVAVNFWDIVVNNHTYITGGNSEWEHFGQPNILDAERTNCNCETCNTYNMMKLSDMLFRITGDRKYADYRENTFINAILSSQNPETGMTTYFQPMATGYFKVYSSPTDNFWCCTGSGMENFSKLSDGIYYSDTNGIYVARYTSSELTLAEKGIVITQKSDLPNATFTVEGNADMNIRLRIPDWCAGAPTVKINGTVVDTSADKEFIMLSRNWNDGDIIELVLPMKVSVFGLPDNENAIAFKYGPWVLSADLGDKNMQTSTTGVNVTIPLPDDSINDIIRIKSDEMKDRLKFINENFVRQGDSLRFILKGMDRELTFSPHYLQHKKRYGIYFRLEDCKAELQDDKGHMYTVIDSLPVANDQYEFSHNLQADRSSTGNLNGQMFRNAAFGGFFSYDMAVDNSVTNYLEVKYCKDDADNTFKVTADGITLENAKLKYEKSDAFFKAYYELTDELISGKDKITVSFEPICAAGRIFDKLSIVKCK